MPSVSATRSSASTWSLSPAAGASGERRCRSSASLTRIRSSLIAPATVDSSARLRPLRLPRACAISDSLGRYSPRPNTCRISPMRPWSVGACATKYSSWRVSSSGGSLRNAASPPSASRLISCSTFASACFSGRVASNAFFASASSVPAATQNRRRACSESVIGTSCSQTSVRSRIVAALLSSFSQRSSADWNRLRSVSARRLSSSAASGSDGPAADGGSGRDRSGENSTASDRPFSPRGSRSSLSSGSSTIGMSRWPLCRRSR